MKYEHVVRTIKSLERLLESEEITPSTRRHAKEVKEALEKELEALESSEN